MSFSNPLRALWRQDRPAFGVVAGLSAPDGIEVSWRAVDPVRVERRKG